MKKNFQLLSSACYTVRSGFLALALTCAWILSGCSGAKDSDKIADAQNCLDTATATEAANCVSKVDGINSSAADLIRCVGKFVKEGFNDSTKMANAITQLKNNGNGSNGSTAMMAALVFRAEATTALNSASVQQTLRYCTSANSKGLILLAGLAQTSTVLTDIAGANPATLTGSDLQTIMAANANNPAAQAAVGTAIVSIYSANCGTGQTTTGNFCQQFNSVVSSVSGGVSNSSGVGQRVMFCYANPNDSSCVGFNN